MLTKTTILLITLYKFMNPFLLCVVVFGDSIKESSNNLQVLMLFSKTKNLTNLKRDRTLT